MTITKSVGNMSADFFITKKGRFVTFE